MGNKNSYLSGKPVGDVTQPTLPKTKMPIEKLPDRIDRGVAELPVQKPAYDTQPTAATPSMQLQQAAPASVTHEVQRAYADPEPKQTAQQEASPGVSTIQPKAAPTTQQNTFFTYEDFWKQYADSGKDPSKHSQTGGYTADGKLYKGTPRPVPEGASGADEDLMSDGDYAYVQYCKAMYADSQARGDKAGMAYWHSEAEKIRAKLGYSGGVDGSEYNNIPSEDTSSIPSGLKAIVQKQSGSIGQQGTTTATGSNQYEESMRNALQQLKDAALKQANGQIDFATQQAIKELERALEDAQPQFKEQAESISLDERQAMDNAALYAELRGDRGGIGQEQYSSVQNTAAQNRLAVQQAQTKLSTDTARQIEDLRAQGEFEKADKLLEVTQQYLSQLIGLEQWAAEFNLSQQQFQAQLQQWEAEYQLSLDQFGFNKEQAAISNQQWQQQFDASLDQWLKEFEFNKEQADIGNSQWQQQFDAALEQWKTEFGLDEKKFEEAVKQWAAEFGLDEKQFEAAIEQWAAEFGLDEKQFEAALDQWLKEYEFNKDQADISNKQWQQQFDAAVDQWEAEFGLDEKQLEAALEQWLKEFEFDKEQAGISNSQWQQQFEAALEQWRKEFALTEQEVSFEQWLKTQQLNSTEKETEDVFNALYSYGFTKESTAEDIASFLQINGIDKSLAAAYAAQFISRGYDEIRSAAGENWGDGYDTTPGDGSFKGSEWGAVKNTILQNLMNGQFDAVRRYLDEVSGGFSLEQWKEIEKLLDQYNFNLYGI